jgi:toxin ParE1/3/4
MPIEGEATRHRNHPELIWHPEARRDLLDIYLLIAHDNPTAAERLYDAIEAKTLQLIDHPRLGPRRNDIRSTARMLVEGPYLILFETHPDTMKVRSIGWKSSASLMAGGI